MPDLPPVTEHDVAQYPGAVRKMPNGGYAWCCSLCKQVASSSTPKGPRCYQHGGTRKRARDRLKSSQAKEAGKTLNPPGRPYTNGWYSRGEQVEVDELVERYRTAQLNPDATDEDMLHLRARLNRLYQTGPSALEVETQLKTALAELERLNGAFIRSKAEPRTVENVLSELEALTVCADVVAEAGEVFERFLKHDDAIQKRHVRLVKLAQTRATTRVKTSTGEQLEVFTLLLERLLVVLELGLDPDTFSAIQKRLQTELSEVPKRLLEPNTVARKRR